jgi:hypothetical protein
VTQQSGTAVPEFERQVEELDDEGAEEQDLRESPEAAPESRRIIPQIQPPPEITPEDVARLEDQRRVYLDYLAKQAEVQKLKDQILTATKAKRYRTADESDEETPSRGPNTDLKIKNVPILNLGCTLQQRQDWIRALNRGFRGAPRKYHTDEKCVLEALNWLHSSCQARWDRYVENEQRTDPDFDDGDWETFEKWTKTLLFNAENLETEMVRALTNASQRPNQTPQAFDAYLDSLESYFERQPESFRASQFLVKLQPKLRDHIEATVTQLPQTRDEMVAIAARMAPKIMPTLKRGRNEDATDDNYAAKRA